MTIQFGKLAYEAYQRSLAECGVKVAQWMAISSEEKIAWETGAQKVAKAVLPHDVLHEPSSVAGSQKSTAELLDRFEETMRETR